MYLLLLLLLLLLALQLHRLPVQGRPAVYSIFFYYFFLRALQLHGIYYECLLNQMCFFLSTDRFLSVLSAVYSMAHPTLQPGENNVMTVVLLQDAASAA